MAELATVARPYAKALYGLAQEQNKFKPWLDELALLVKVSEDPKVQSLIQSPKYSRQEKVTIFLQLFGVDSGVDSIDPLLKNFILVLADNNRLELLDAIYQQFNELILAREHIEQAVVYSAFPLTDKELGNLVKKIETKYQVKLDAKLVVESELIGGFKVEFGDQVLDMSVKSELASLYRTMIN